MNPSQLLPFTCHRCDIEFSASEGGICHRCGHHFCLDHLWEVREGKISLFLCNEHRGDRRGTRRTSDTLRTRRLFGRS